MLVLTGSADRDLMMRAVRLGVHGFLRKTADTAEVLAAVRSLLRGEGVFAAGPVRPVDVRRPGHEPRGPGLTERENQVLKLLAVGMSNREIGDRLLISEATVKFHVRNLRDKLEVRGSAPPRSCTPATCRQGRRLAECRGPSTALRLRSAQAGARDQPKKTSASA